MNKQTEALKMAIEQIKWAEHLHDWHDGLLDALQACKEALEQPQQTAKQKYDKFMEGANESSALERLRFFCAQAMNGQDWLDVEPFLNALEQPAQEYLTRAQQVIRANNSAQEPVAKGFIRSLVSIDKNGIETWKEEPFYTSPPSWQGLSDDEIEYWECLKAPPVHPDFLEDDSWYEFARAIEQALKEKNHA